MKSYYEVVGSSSTGDQSLSPIIFLHGLGDCILTWKKVAPVIAKTTGRKAYLLDARNHGESPWMCEMNYEVLTQDLVDFMNEHEIEKAIIVGHSMGGRTAINFALKHPERTDAIIVEDMTPKNVFSGNKSFFIEMFEVVKELIKSIPSDVDLQTARQNLLDTFTSITNRKFLNGEKFKKHYELDMIPIRKVGNTFVPMADVKAVAAMLVSNALVQNLPEQGLTFHGDVLFLFGSMPFYNIAKDTCINKLFPRALKVKIEGASHLIHLDSPDAFSQVVSNFILHRNLLYSKY